jgi:hypothetical protein
MVSAVDGCGSGLLENETSSGILVRSRGKTAWNKSGRKYSKYTKNATFCDVTLFISAELCYLQRWRLLVHLNWQWICTVLFGVLSRDYVQPLMFWTVTLHKNSSDMVWHGLIWARITQSVKRLSTGLTVRDRVPAEEKFSATVQTDRGVYPTYYTMGTGYFQGVKRPGHGVDHPLSSSADVKEKVELYFYSPSGPSWPVLGWPLPFTHFY